MSATGALRKFASDEESVAAPLALLMRNGRTKPPKLVTDTVTQDVQLKDASDAVRLRAVWDSEKAKNRSISQKAMALEWGVHASNITQYLNGHINLNIEAKLRFARYLGKPVLEIWPDFEFASVTPGDLPPEAAMIAAMWTTLPEASKTAVFNLIKSLSGASI